MNLLQTPNWGELKKRFGWTAHYIETTNATAQILFRHLPLGLTIAYLPKGPTLDWADIAARQAIFTLIHLEAKKRRAIFLKVEPDVWESADNSAVAVNFLSKSGFVPARTIQPRATALVDLTGSEAEILAAMKQKTRYNIRLAEKKGVTIRVGEAEDVAKFFALTQLTATRDCFAIHNLAYYQTAYQQFAPEHGALLLAEFEHDPLAALMAFCEGETAYYLYGASSNEKRNLMPAYLLQWEAMRWAKQHGCTTYDLWGIPDADPTTLEAEFERRDDGLWGVYRFKRGFGGRIQRAIGAFDYVYRPVWYRLYKLFRYEK